MSFANRSSARIVCALVGLGAVASAASADQITFAYGGTASGTVGGVPFAATNFTITATADTANNVGFSEGVIVDNTTATIDIQGVGFYTITTQTTSAVNNNSSAVIFGNKPQDLALFIVANAGFSTYDLASDFGPVGGNASVLQWNIGGALDSDGGVIVLSSNANQGTFTATIPTPGSLALVGIAALGLARRRR